MFLWNITLTLFYFLVITTMLYLSFIYFFFSIIRANRLDINWNFERSDLYWKMNLKEVWTLWFLAQVMSVLSILSDTYSVWFVLHNLYVAYLGLRMISLQKKLKMEIPPPLIIKRNRHFGSWNKWRQKLNLAKKLKILSHEFTQPHFRPVRFSFLWSEI